MPAPEDHLREATRLTDKALCLADVLDDTGWLRYALTRIRDHIALATPVALPDLDEELARLVADNRKAETDPSRPLPD